jgi:hypothetical protein
MATNPAATVSGVRLSDASTGGHSALPRTTLNIPPPPPPPPPSASTSTGNSSGHGGPED